MDRGRGTRHRHVRLGTDDTRDKEQIAETGYRGREIRNRDVRLRDRGRETRTRNEDRGHRTGDKEQRRKTGEKGRETRNRYMRQGTEDGR